MNLNMAVSTLQSEVSWSAYQAHLLYTRCSSLQVFLKDHLLNVEGMRIYIRVVPRLVIFG